MQVDRQPSPWPCVAMLAGLLLMCLMAPRYWRDGNTADTTERAAKNAPVVPAVTVNLPAGAEPDVCLAPPRKPPAQDFDLLQLWAPPTIEELIDRRAGMSALEAPPCDWLALPPANIQHRRQAPAPPAANPLSLEPFFAAAFARIGRMLVDYSPIDAVAHVSRKAADLHGKWASLRRKPSEPAHAPFTVKLVTSEEEQAIAFPPVEVAPVPIDHDQELAASPLEEPWCVPQVLMDQLRRLAHHPASAAWADRTIAQLQALTQRERLGGDDVNTILAKLSDSAQEAARMAEATRDDRLRVELLRAHWALARRLDCWAVLHEIRVAERARERVALHGSLESFFTRPGQQFTPPPGTKLTADLETYERSRDPRLGRQVVRQQQALSTSADALDRSLSEAVEQHYRNANVRVAVTAELLNRLIAREHSETRLLSDRIAGTPVRGHSQVQSDSRVRLEPAEGRWRLTLETDGVVDSNTLADGGPARLRTYSATDFAARKSILVDAGGVRTERAVVDANSHNRLVGVTTDFDWVPLVGSLVRDRAVTQYRARSQRARAEIERRVAAQAVAQVDRDTLEAVERVERQVRERLTDRLAEAGVGVSPIEMLTSRERVVGRFRVASEHQLGSHTPRPRALSDSLASVQLHESALTNAAVSLELDGRRFTGAELQRLLRKKFPRMASDGDVARSDVAFYFAQQDAVQFHINDGRLEVTLSLAAVQQDDRLMRDVAVHAYYVPVVDGLAAELVRDGALGIEGRLSSAERARLHNVFNSVLPIERRLPILRLENSQDPRLEGLMITQLVLEDGWLGLAIGPEYGERVAERSRSLR